MDHFSASVTGFSFRFIEPMASKRKIRRYAAYIHGWATAFGSHDKRFDETRDLLWLYGQDQIGLILTPTVKQFLRPLFIGTKKKAPPKVRLGGGVLRIADEEIVFGDQDAREVDAVMDLLTSPGDLYLLQTYHLVYPSGTRILTLTRQTPLPLVYREIEPLKLRLI